MLPLLKKGHTHEKKYLKNYSVLFDGCFFGDRRIR
jgi:hypothetical protein